MISIDDIWLEQEDIQHPHTPDLGNPVREASEDNLLPQNVCEMWPEARPSGDVGRGLNAALPGIA